MMPISLGSPADDLPMPAPAGGSGSLGSSALGLLRAIGLMPPEGTPTLSETMAAQGRDQLNLLRDHAGERLADVASKPGQDPRDLDVAMQLAGAFVGSMKDASGAGAHDLGGGIVARRGNGAIYTIRDGDKRVGSVSLADGGEKPFIDLAMLEPEYRRRGIASRLYDAIEGDLGRPLLPNPLGLSPEATAFWQKRMASLSPEARAALLNEAKDIGRSYGIGDEHLAPRLDPIGLGPQEAPLDMSQAARMARAKEMGFDVDRPLYHGTTRDFSELSMAAPKTTGGGLIDRAMFGSYEPRVASRYAQDFAPEGGDGANVIKGYLRSEKPADMKMQDFAKLQQLYGKQQRGEPLSEMDQVSLDILGDDYFGGALKHNADIIDQIQARGYDALRADKGRFGSAESEVAFFDPSQFRSAHSAFDPAKKNSADLLASVAAGGIGLGALGYGSDE